MKKENLEKIIKKESKTMFENSKIEIFNALGIDYKDNVSLSEQKKIENKIKKERKNFVPDYKDNIYASCGIKKRPSLLSLIKKPTVYGPFLTAACGLALCGVIILNQPQKNDPPINEQILPTESNSINFKITSASKKYEPEVLYTINNKGEVNLEKLVCLNDASTNIISQIENNQSFNGKQFALSYLNKALDIGYLERINFDQYNEISINISSSIDDIEYAKKSLESLSSLIDEFSYQNKVIIKYSFNIDQEERSDVDSELLVLIKQAYYMTNKAFTKLDGTSSRFFAFSSNLNDWIEKYKDFEKEEMQNYVDFLIKLDEAISSEAKKESFLNDVDLLTPYLEYTEKLTYYFNLIKEKLNGFINAANESGLSLNNEFENMKCYPWDWWNNYGLEKKDDFRPPHRSKHGYYENNIEDFIEFLSTYVFNYDDCKIKDDFRKKWEDISDLIYDIIDYYDSIVDEIDMGFELILDKASNGYYWNENEHFEDNRHERPSDWDEHFDEWYYSNHHHH